MKQFIIHLANQKLTLDGDTLDAAVGNNFGRIIEAERLGNVAGVNLSSAYMVWDEKCFNGKGGVELHLTTCGSDTMIGYDPTKDKEQETICYVEATRADLPKRYDFQFSENNNVDYCSPFNKPATPGFLLGYIQGLLNEISLHHCIRKPRSGGYSQGIADQILDNMPTLPRINPKMYLERCRQLLTSLSPKTDAETHKLIERLNELVIMLYETDESVFRDEETQSWAAIARHQNAYYFSTLNKVTAMAYYRKKAGLTAKELADRVGMSSRQITRYESAGSSLGRASCNTIAKIADVLDIEPSQLVEHGHAVFIERTI